MGQIAMAGEWWAEGPECPCATPMRTEKATPDAYRLAKKPDGTVVLQGAYLWQEGWNHYGHEWRDIPTVEL